MDIDFLTRDGAVRTCRYCGHENFITNRGVMEMRDDARTEYPFRCSDCGERYMIPLDSLRGYHQTELTRITISG